VRVKLDEYLAVEDFDRLPVFDDFAPPPVAPRWGEFFADLASLFLLCILIAWAAVRPMARGTGER
jgi:hypothetical protein